MKTTNNDLLKLMKLRAGDKIRVDGCNYAIGENYALIGADKDFEYHNMYVGILIAREIDYDIIPRPERIGDQICKYIECKDCPLKNVGCGNVGEKATLYETLNDWLKTTKDKEIYELLKTRLDKEVA